MYKRNFLLILIIFFLNGCISTNNKLNNLNTINLTSNQKTKNYDNYVFHEYLNRIFKSEINKAKMYSLLVSINFGSTNTLTSKNLSTLSKTIATVNFELYDINTNKLLKAGSLKSAPAIGSTSSSLFSNDINSNHIKERLIKNLALKLSRYLNIIIPKLK